MTTANAPRVESYVADSAAADGDGDTPSFFDLILTEGRPMDQLVLDGSRLSETIQKLVVLSVASLMLYGAVVGLSVQSIEMSGWFGQGQPVVWMPMAFSGAFLTAIAVCLPSFYFYTQLAGLDASFRLITAQSLRVQARTSVVLLGVMPFYAALALATYLGVDIGLGGQTVVLIGVGLPFWVGLVGIAALYRSFKRLVDDLPITHHRRGNIVLRLVLAWGAVFSCVAPVALWRLGQSLGKLSDTIIW